MFFPQISNQGSLSATFLPYIPADKRNTKLSSRVKIAAAKNLKDLEMTQIPSI